MTRPLHGGVKFNGQEKTVKRLRELFMDYYFNKLAFFTEIKTVLMSSEL